MFVEEEQHTLGRLAMLLKPEKVTFCHISNYAMADVLLSRYDEVRFYSSKVRNVKKYCWSIERPICGCCAR